MSPAPAGAFRPGDVLLGLYQVREVHTGGGMGLVYRVRHRVWGIDLAMKSPRPDSFRTPGQKAAFVRECETWIRLGLHPHMVSCYYVRVLDGVPHVFAEYVSGGTLSSWIRRGGLGAGGDDPLRPALDVAVQCAWGLLHAHSTGVIHRDVKPGNVMMTKGGVAKVTDFGLALARGEPGRGGYTPAYCSPEQAARKPLKRTTDVWSLGLTILEMFTGGLTWFAGQAAPEVLEDHLSSPPRDPDLPRMPDDLADVLRDCFRMDPEERPSDLGQVADRVTRIYEATFGPYERKRPRVAEHRADGLNNGAVSFVDLGRVEEAEDLLGQAVAADPHHVEANYNRGLLDWRAGRVSDEVLVKSLEEVRRTDPDGWRAPHLLALVHLERADVTAALPALEEALARGGPEPELRDALAAAREALSRSVRPDPLAEGLPDRVLALAATPDGHSVVAATGDLAVVHEAGTGEGGRRLEGHTDEIRACVASRDGRWVATGSADQTVRLWHLSSGRCRRFLAGHRSAVTALALSPNSRFLLSGDGEGNVRLFDLVTGRCVRAFRPHEDAIGALAFSPNGKEVLSGSWDRTVRHLDLARGRSLGTLRAHSDWVDAVVFHPDGRRAVTAGHDGTIRIFDLRAGLPISRLDGHGGAVVALDLTPDGGRIVSAGHDGTVRLWDLGAGRCLRTFAGHTGAVNGVACVEEGRRAISGGEDRTLRTWALEEVGSNRAGFAISTPTSGARLSERERGVVEWTQSARQALFEGRRAEALAMVSEARRVPGYERNEELRSMWDEIGRYGRRTRLRGGWAVYVVNAHDDTVTGVRVSPDGRRILTSGTDRTLRIHDAATGRPIEVLRGHVDEVEACDFGPEGRTAVTAGADKTVRWWDLGTGSIVWTAEGHGDWVDAVRASPDGRTVLSSGHDGSIRRMDAGTGAETGRFEPGGGPVEALAISGAGERFLAGSQDGVVRLFELDGGDSARRLAGHRDWVSSVGFTPNDRFVVAGGWDGTIRIWDAADGEAVRTIEAHPGGVSAIAASPHGRWLFSGGQDASIRLWDLESGRCERAFEGHLGPVRGVAWSPDGLHLYSVGEDRTLRAWYLDWQYEIVEDRAPDDAARGALTALLFRREEEGELGEEELERLREELARRGFAGLAPEAVRRAVGEVLSRRKA